jgi:hypothetical protein
MNQYLRIIQNKGRKQTIRIKSLHEQMTQMYEDNYWLVCE